MGYESPPNPNTLDRNMMWFKQFLKGIAEGIPNDVWLGMFQLIEQASEIVVQAKFAEVENMNEAYAKGYHLARGIFTQLRKEEWKYGTESNKSG